MTATPIDTRFYVPRTPVAVIALGDSGEALLIRALLEHLGAVVTLHLPGTPEDALLILGQGAAAPPYLVLCGHGDDDGFILGDYGPGIDTSALQGQSLPPGSIAARIRLPGCVVVSTACATGSPDFAAAFIQGGVSAYIAPDDYPDGAGAALFLHLLFHHLLVDRTNLVAAWERAAGYDDTCRMFVLATAAGTKKWSESHRTFPFGDSP